MKLLSLNEWAEDFYSINEKLNSTILRGIVSQMSKHKSLANYKSVLKWDKITDNDIEEIPIRDARRKKYEEYILFWMAGSEFIGVSWGKHVVERVGARGWEPKPSSKALQDISDTVYGISEETQDRYSSLDLIRARQDARRGAVAMRDPSSIKEENMERYAKIIASKKVQDDEIDIKVGKLMERYSQKMIALGKEDKWYEVGEVNEKIKNLLANYQDYISARGNARTEGTKLYVHQGERIKRFIDAINRAMP